MFQCQENVKKHLKFVPLKISLQTKTNLEGKRNCHEIRDI